MRLLSPVCINRINLALVIAFVTAYFFWILKDSPSSFIDFFTDKRPNSTTTTTTNNATASSTAHFTLNTLRPGSPSRLSSFCDRTRSEDPDLYQRVLSAAPSNDSRQLLLLFHSERNLSTTVCQIPGVNTPKTFLQPNPSSANRLKIAVRHPFSRLAESYLQYSEQRGGEDPEKRLMR